MTKGTNESRGISGPVGGYIAHILHTMATIRPRQNVLHSHTLLGTAGDASDDTIAADVVEVITVGTQPANSTSSSGAGHSLLQQQ